MKRGLIVKTLNWQATVTAVFCVFLATACSKKLMPPEIETLGGASEEMELIDPSPAPGSSDSPEASERALGGSGGAEDSSFFSEEPILEHGSSSTGSSGSFAEKSNEGSILEPILEQDFSSTEDPGSFFTGDSGSFAEEPILEGGPASRGFASSEGGSTNNGSSDFFDTNQFDSGGQGSGSFGSSGSMDSGTQEARLLPFQESSDLKDIYFEFDKYDLDDNSKAILKENADYLKRNPNLHVEVQGHCDERGTNNYNIALGERRAHSIKKYLMFQGIHSRKVRVISFGEEKPFCFDSNETCWYQNRRAHFMVSK